MALDTSDTWAQTRDEIIKDALANLGVVGPDATPSGPSLLHAARTLSSLIKSLDSEGQLTCRISEFTKTTTDGTASYALDTSAYDVDAPMNFKRSGSNERSLIHPMTRDEYMSIADRTIEGVPSRYYIEKSIDSSTRAVLTMYLWPVPDATGDTVTYAAFSRAKDVDLGTHNPSYPQPWIRCLKYGLSIDLAPTYGQAALIPAFKAIFDEEKFRLLNADNEKQNLTFVPFGL